VSYAVAYSIGYPVQLSVLGPSSRLDKDGAGLIDRTLASGRRHGYVFTYAPGRPAAGGIASYTIHADPSPPGRAGLRHFFTNESGVIRVNAWARASASDGVYKEAANSAPANPVKSGRIRVSSEVQALRLIIRAAPQYPELARQARIQGTVRMRAIVAKDGTVEQLDVISGPPMLVRAAIDAAKDWRYAPTVIGGNPVEVETIIEVNFSLKDLPPPGKAPN
jgi:TonB family protein